MGVVQELSDLVTHFLKCYDIVHQYEQGLYIHKGIITERCKKKLEPEDKERIEAQERELRGIFGYRAFSPFRRPKLPEEFRQSKITGLPLHRDRYSKILQPGVYFFFPLTDEIVRRSIQEMVLNLGNITVPTSDQEFRSMLVSCNLRCELDDLYLGFNKVHDYEASLKDHTLSILAKYSRGKTSDEWKTPSVIEEIERNVSEELQETARGWGLTVHKVYITSQVPATVQLLTHEGLAVQANLTPHT